MELQSDEIKLLLVNLEKKKESVLNNENELKKVESRITELSSILKDRNQNEINSSFNEIIDEIDNSIDILKTHFDVSNELNLDSSLVEPLGSLATNILNVKYKLNSIIESQKDLQNTDNPINYYFNYLVIPLNNTTAPNNSSNILTPQLTTQPQPQHVELTVPNYNQLPTMNIVPNPQDLQNKRNRIMSLANSEQYDRIYSLVKDSSGKINIQGLEDIFNTTLTTGDTLFEKVQPYEPVLDYEIIGEDVDSTPVQINYSNNFNKLNSTPLKSNTQYYEEQEIVNDPVNQLSTTSSNVMNKIRGLWKD